MDYVDPIHFTFFAVNGAGNGAKADFIYLIKKQSGYYFCNPLFSFCFLPSIVFHCDKCVYHWIINLIKGVRVVLFLHKPLHIWDVHTCTKL